MCRESQILAKCSGERGNKKGVDYRCEENHRFLPSVQVREGIRRESITGVREVPTSNHRWMMLFPIYVCYFIL